MFFILQSLIILNNKNKTGVENNNNYKTDMILTDDVINACSDVILKIVLLELAVGF